MRSPRGLGVGRIGAASLVLTLCWAALGAGSVLGAENKDDKKTRLLAWPEPPAVMEVGDRHDFVTYACVGDAVPPARACRVKKTKVLTTGNELLALNTFEAAWILDAIREGEASLVLRLKQGKKGKTLRGKHRISVVAQTVFPGQDKDDPEYDDMFDKPIDEVFFPERVEAMPEEIWVEPGETVYVAVSECAGEDCRPAGAVSMEHDEDGDILADSIEVSEGGWMRFKAGPNTSFDVARLVTDHGRAIISIAIEEGVRANREQGDFNGRNGIDADDVLQIWARQGESASDESFDDWADLIDDGVIDEADVNEANSRSEAAGNGTFAPASLGSAEPPSFES